MVKYGLKRTIAKYRLKRRLQALGGAVGDEACDLAVPVCMARPDGTAHQNLISQSPRETNQIKSSTHKCAALLQRVAGFLPGKRKSSAGSSEKRTLSAKLCSWALNIELVATTLVALLLWIGPVLGLQSYAISSGSMEPALPQGSLALVAEPIEPAIGDVIAFKLGGAVVIHRVMGVAEGAQAYVTQGDANQMADPAEVLQSDVLGTVVLHLPYVGTVLGLLSTYKMWALAGVAVANGMLAWGASTRQRQARTLVAEGSAL